jgi:hypothetical protein
MFNHPGWEAYWNGSGWHGRRDGGRGIAWQGLKHVERFDSLRFISFLELMNWITCHVRWSFLS